MIGGFWYPFIPIEGMPGYYMRIGSNIPVRRTAADIKAVIAVLAVELQDAQEADAMADRKAALGEYRRTDDGAHTPLHEQLAEAPSP